MRLLLAILLLSSLATGDNTAKQAAHDFRQGLKLQKKDPQRAFELFRQAADLEPKNAEYATARELARQQLVYAHIQQGNRLLAAAKPAEAQDEFRVALALDPTNDFAIQRLRDLAPPQAPPSRELQTVSQSAEIELHPAAGRKSFHFNGDSRAFIEQLARAFNLSVQFDDSFISRRARIDLDDVDFYAALEVANQLSKSFGVPIDETHLLMLANNPENHRQFDHFSMRTFYLPDTSTPQEMNEIVSLLRGLFEIRFLLPQASEKSITVRAPKPLLDAAATFVENLDQGAPQVMLDLQAFEVNQSMMRNLGMQLPTSIQIFHVPTVLASLTTNSGTQDLVNQLISSGTINQSTAQSIPALLAQLKAQQNPILSQGGFASFGGGNTRFAAVFPSIPINFSYNDSRVTSLEQLQLRASQNNPATMKIGSRVPILNASYAPIFNSSAISQVLGNQSFQAPFPSFSYEDIGIDLKATPKIHLPQEMVFDPRSSEPAITKSSGLASVTLDLDLQIRALTGNSFNGVPIISNRQYTGSVRLNEGEPAIVVGFLTSNDQRSISGPVGLGQLPLLRHALSDENKQQSNTELLILITPHVVRGRTPGLATEQWLPPGN